MAVTVRRERPLRGRRRRPPTASSTEPEPPAGGLALALQRTAGNRRGSRPQSLHRGQQGQVRAVGRPARRDPGVHRGGARRAQGDLRIQAAARAARGAAAGDGRQDGGDPGALGDDHRCGGRARDRGGWPRSRRRRRSSARRSSPLWARGPTRASRRARRARPAGRGGGEQARGGRGSREEGGRRQAARHRHRLPDRGRRAGHTRGRRTTRSSSSASMWRSRTGRYRG